MAKYAAFLRGINVGGQRVVKMEKLREIFTSAGMEAVKTYIQSGNVIFESREADAATLELLIRQELSRSLGYEVPIFIRTISQLEEIIKYDPFNGIAPTDEVKQYITFLSEEPTQKTELPVVSPAKDVEVIKIRNREAFSLCYKINGRFGAPNSFLEKKFGVAATSRYWTIISNIISLVRPDASAGK
ncbi:MAG: DUF1697 domain-containing protein [Ignavibacteriales bacterium]